LTCFVVILLRTCKITRPKREGVFMVEKFEKLAKLSKSEQADKKTINGFSARQKTRESAYSERAKSQSPDDAFYARSYNL